MSLTITAFETAVRIGCFISGLYSSISAARRVAVPAAAFAVSAAAAGVKRAAASKRWPLPPRWSADRTVFPGVSELRWRNRCALRAVRMFRRQEFNRP